MVAEVMHKMSKKMNWKKPFGKKWTFPAIYITAAALILTLMWWYQDPNQYPLTSDELGYQEINPASTTTKDDLLTDQLGEAIAVTAALEKMVWPVENPDQIQVMMEYFDESQSDEALESALIEFQNEFWAHRGIDLVTTDKQTFGVVAALSGEVVKAEKDPVVGYVVNIKHDNDLVTVYSSLADLQVKKGDMVTQGQLLGNAGRNAFEKDHGIHLHFEVMRNEFTLAPEAFIGEDASQVLKMLEEKAKQETEQGTEEQTGNQETPDSETDKDKETDQNVEESNQDQDDADQNAEESDQNVEE